MVCASKGAKCAQPCFCSSLNSAKGSALMSESPRASLPQEPLLTERSWCCTLLVRTDGRDDAEPRALDPDDVDRNPCNCGALRGVANRSSPTRGAAGARKPHGEGPRRGARREH